MPIVFVQELEREGDQSPTVVAFLDDVCGFGEVLLQACQGGEWGELRGTENSRDIMSNILSSSIISRLACLMDKSL